MDFIGAALRPARRAMFIDSSEQKPPSVRRAMFIDFAEHKPPSARRAMSVTQSTVWVLEVYMTLLAEGAIPGTSTL